MNFYNKTTLLPSLDELHILLIDGLIINPYCFFCVGRRISIEHKQIGIKHSIRIWKTQSVFKTESVFIAALDYTVDTDIHYVKIDYISINDGDHGSFYEDCLDPNTAQELVENLIDFIQTVAKTNHIAKITMDVHNNLRIYNKYYKQNGFQLTDRKCEDNPIWIETEKII